MKTTLLVLLFLVAIFQTFGDDNDNCPSRTFKYHSNPNQLRWTGVSTRSRVDFTLRTAGPGLTIIVQYKGEPDDSDDNDDPDRNYTDTRVHFRYRVVFRALYEYNTTDNSALESDNSRSINRVLQLTSWNRIDSRELGSAQSRIIIVTDTNNVVNFTILVNVPVKIGNETLCPSNDVKFNVTFNYDNLRRLGWSLTGNTRLALGGSSQAHFNVMGRSQPRDDEEEAVYEVDDERVGSFGWVKYLICKNSSSGEDYKVPVETPSGIFRPGATDSNGRNYQTIWSFVPKNTVTINDSCVWDPVLTVEGDSAQFTFVLNLVFVVALVVAGLFFQ